MRPFERRDQLEIRDAGSGVGLAEHEVARRHEAEDGRCSGRDEHQASPPGRLSLDAFFARPFLQLQTQEPEQATEAAAA